MFDDAVSMVVETISVRVQWDGSAAWQDVR